MKTCTQKGAEMLQKSPCSISTVSRALTARCPSTTLQESETAMKLLQTNAGTAGDTQRQCTELDLLPLPQTTFVKGGLTWAEM